MTPRDDLIEALAKIRYGDVLGGNWDALPDDAWKEGARAIVREEAPVIVAFVAEWLADRLERQQLQNPVEAWREEMA